MTEDELRVELECYKAYVKPECDIDNMSKEEMKDFYDNYKERELYINNLDDSKNDA